mgnify:FL=1
MNLRESSATAVRSLLGNKVRSGLTMLGIVIGVAAVIAMLSVGHGAQQAVTGQIQSIGSNLLFVISGSAESSRVRMPIGTAQTLTYEDALAIAQPANCPSVARVAPEVMHSVVVVYRGENVSTRLYGVTPEYALIRNYELAEGEFIGQAHMSTNALVAVLGAETARSLFGDDDALGKNIRISNTAFRVIGVLAPKGGTGFGSQDDMVLVPLTTAWARLGRRSVHGGTAVSVIYVQALDERLVGQATDEIRMLLRERHRTPFDEDFQIYSQADILALANQVTGVLTIFLGGIAAISLLVGGIGIMNIMLVSVTERTREIGIRKAVGAKRRDILSQFLTEATLLSVIGGALGILLGWGISQAIAAISASSGTPIYAVLSPGAVLLATGFSIAVGLFFGIYPAARAASLNPIDALRHE